MPLLTPKFTPVDEDLSTLEKDIRIFKIQYEQYFGGGRSRPPGDVEWRIEQMMKRYGERPAEINSAQRFRYQTLAQTYVKFREMFRKRLQQREEGTVQRHYGAAARAIEEERARRSGRAPAPGQPSEEGKPTTILFTDPEHELREVERLYQALQEARAAAGDTTKPLDREQFLDVVKRKTQELRKGKAHSRVEYSVVVEDGKPRLKASLKKKIRETRPQTD